MPRVYIIKLLVVLILPISLSAQVRSSIRDSVVNAKLLTLSYAVQFPAGDLADRFGNNNNLSAAFYFKFGNNYLLGGRADYIFSGNIKEDTILNDLFTQSGNLIGVGGFFETAILYERGFAVYGMFGKLIPVLNSNPNSGITLFAGAGFLQHRIKIEDINNQLPYVTGEYGKGYDRLTNGAAIIQSLGYTHLDDRKLLNFSLSFEATEAFTKSRRDWNFDQMLKDDKNRLDILLGIRLSWMLPFYGSNEERFYTY